MKLINVIGFAILIKNLIVAVVISIWYCFSKLFDNLTAFLEAALLSLISD